MCLGWVFWFEWDFVGREQRFYQTMHTYQFILCNTDKGHKFHQLLDTQIYLHVFIPVKKYSPYLTVNQVIRKVHCRWTCALKETVSFVKCKICSLKKGKTIFIFKSIVDSFSGNWDLMFFFNLLRLIYLYRISSDLHICVHRVHVQTLNCLYWTRISVEVCWHYCYSAISELVSSVGYTAVCDGQN